MPVPTRFGDQMETKPIPKIEQPVIYAELVAELGDPFAKDADLEAANELWREAKGALHDVVMAAYLENVDKITAESRE